MKTIPLAILLLFCGVCSLQGQNSTFIPQKKYNTWIIPDHGHKVKKGLLLEVKDSSIVLAHGFNPVDYEKGVLKTEKVDARNINVIKVRKKGAEAAILIGGISGAVLGGVLMAAYEQNLRKTQDPLEHLFIGTMLSLIHI